MDQGASLAGPGYSAEPEPVPVSSVPASIPSAVAFSSDVYNPRVLRVHFSAPTGDAERRYLLDSINALTMLPELLGSIKDAIFAIEKGDLYESMCCDGHMCGCRGSSNAEFLVHCLRETLGKAQAMSAGTAETAQQAQGHSPASAVGNADAPEDLPTSQAEEGTPS